MFIILAFVLGQSSGRPVHCASSIFPAQKLQAAQSYHKPVYRTDYQPPRVGEKRILWLWNMSVMPPRQYQTSVTCYGSGDNCYVMVEDSCWQNGIVDSTKVLRVLERFNRSSPTDPNKGVWQHNTGLFGAPPDEIDHDSLVYILYYNIGEFHGQQFDGFWMFYDEYYDTTSMRLWGYHSNEIECVYIDCYPHDISTDYRMAIVAHEFEHMIHWNHDKDEMPWVDEGCAELAMLVYGSPDYISEFNTNPDNDLTLWRGVWSDYIKVYLWSLYLYEQYGEYRRRSLIRNLVNIEANSIEGVDSAFIRCGYAERFAPVFDDWVVANYFDDTLGHQGRYGYYEVTLPPFANSGVHSTYPVNAAGVVTRWGADYIRFHPPVKANLDLRFDGSDNADFSIQTVKVDTAGKTRVVERIALDTLQNGSRRLFDFGNIYNYAVMVIGNHTPIEGGQGYQYWAEHVGVAEPTASTRESRWTQLAISPNPTVGRVAIRVRLTEPVTRGSVDLLIYDRTGRLVRSLKVFSCRSRPFEAGVVYWNGADEYGRALPPGCYFIGLSDADGVVFEKCVIGGN